MADYVSGDMVRGHIDSIILNSLLDSDKDTNMIREEIEKRASGKFQLKQGTFYSALQRIVKNGLVIEYRTTGSDGVRRKFFQLTEKGKTHIEKNQNNWTVSQEIINTLLDSEGPQVKFHKPSEYVKPDKTATVEPEEKLPDFSPTEEEIKIPKFGEEYDETAETLPFDTDGLQEETKQETEISGETSESSGILAENNSDSAIDSLTNDSFKTDYAEISGTATEKYEDAPTTFDDILNMLSKAEASAVSDQEYTENSVESPDSDGSVNVSDATQKNEENSSITASAAADKISLSEDQKRIMAAEQRARELEEARIKAEKEEAARQKLLEEERINEAARIAREKEMAEIRAEAQEAEKRATQQSMFGETTEPAPADYGANNLIHAKFGSFDHVADYSSLNQSAQNSPARGENYKNKPESDDYLSGDDLPEQKSYRDILTKIFASDIKNIEKPLDDAKSETPVAREDLPSNDETAAKTEQKSDVYVDELDFSSIRRHERAEDVFADENKDSEPKKAEKNAEKNKKDDYYSEVLKLSQTEGFKISTADNTNKNELGKILVNRLNFHTSLIFFAVVAIETLIVGLTMESVAKLGVGTYFIFLAVAAILPAVFGIIYYLTPTRAVNDVGSFKGSFETALIITLNLILLIIALAIVINLDFSSISSLARGVFIPVLVAINVPVFVIIRYSLLENQAYFS